ncbi:MAG: maleylpyruvate isomerase family mycothiol-dependent enzyme [Nocardioidaceae bacterium]
MPNPKVHAMPDHDAPTRTGDPAAQIDALSGSAESLEHTLAELTDEQVREPSLLPGWTRGHVLTHIARNADGLGNLVIWAKTGVETSMYVSREQRNADIEAGAGRSVTDLVADVRESQATLMTALADLTEQQWAATARAGSDNREFRATAIPWLRQMEVEVHHVDLNVDYTLAHWPEDFVEHLLSRAAADHSAHDGTPGFVLVASDNVGRWTVGPGGQEVTGPPPSLLGWLLGRTDGIGLHSDEPLPQIGAWR